MATLTIDSSTVSHVEGETLLQAIERSGGRVPTLCHRDGVEPFASCMVCVVHDRTADRYIPACATRSQPGMNIATNTPALDELRRDALQLLLADHAGDCEGPCRMLCPADLDIPEMTRRIMAGDPAGAAAVVFEHIPLPTVLGWICPAPCEKGCRRRDIDDPVAICLLKRYVGEWALQNPDELGDNGAPAGGRTVTIVGAGPTGLTAANYLLLAGHTVTVYDAREQPGGALRYAIEPDALPRYAIDGEVGRLTRLGMRFRGATRLGRDLHLDDLVAGADAVLLATGSTWDYGLGPGAAALTGKAGIDVQRGSARTQREGVFAAGGAVRKRRMAVHAVAAGRRAAREIDAALRDAPATTEQSFNCAMGKLAPRSLQTLAANGSGDGRYAADEPQGFSAAVARSEAARCIHCDCRAARDCRLRDRCDELNARARRYRGRPLPPLQLQCTDGALRYEPGKCIGCGLCVRVSAELGERLGMTFLGRGFRTSVAPPFGAALSDALTATSARACADACPTGALWRPKT